MEAVREVKGTPTSLAQDKVATPPEPAKAIGDYVRGLAPSYVVAERSTRSQANIAENYKAVFARFGKIEIRTGTEMISQHCPWYLGMAFPCTLPCAVGGYDIPNRPRWRRPETKEFPTPRSILASWLKPSMGLAPRELPAEHCTVGAASTV